MIFFGIFRRLLTLAIVGALVVVGLRFAGFREGSRTIDVVLQGAQDAQGFQQNLESTLQAANEGCNFDINFFLRLINVKGADTTVIETTDASGKKEKITFDCVTKKVIDRVPG